MSDGRTYISQAREELQQYTNGLLKENERLRSAAVMLESDLRRTEQQEQAAKGELQKLRSRFDQVADENERFAMQYQYIEAQSGNLANLYVASYQLHSSIDRQAVLTAIQEIVINLIGSEQLAIYERHGADFRLTASFGLDTDRVMSFIGGDLVSERLHEGQIFRDPADQQPLTAHVILQIGELRVGSILVFRLLDHKPKLQPVDHELFDLLSVHASTALYCASLHELLVVRSAVSG